MCIYKLFLEIVMPAFLQSWSDSERNVMRSESSVLITCMYSTRSTKYKNFQETIINLTHYNYIILPIITMVTTD